MRRPVWLDRLFVRSRLLRMIYAGLASLAREPERLDTNHLAAFGEVDAIGPVQRDEALLLLAVVRVLRPHVIVEFGFSRGLSAVNFVLGMPTDCMLFSYDNSADAARRAHELLGNCKNFRFIAKSQDEFEPSDTENREIDLVLIDASHDLALNQATFERLLPALADGAVIAVHDTGTWFRRFLLEEHFSFVQGKTGKWLGSEEYAPWPDERRFVNWLRSRHPEFAQIHLHSLQTLRHGLTLLQRSRVLAV